MACMEHSCAKCGNMEFDNSPKMKKPCKVCGGRFFDSVFDEGGGSGGYFVNIHTCTKCKKVQYSTTDEAYHKCECGSNEFDSQIDDEPRSRPTLSRT